MSSQVWIRPYDAAKDHQPLAEYLYASREKNRFDPEVFKRGQAKIYVAFDDSGALGFIPVVNNNIVESLAFRPGLSPILEAKCLQAWQHVIVYEMHEKNIPDLYFVTYDETVLAFAEKYGWKKVVVPMLNLHASGLSQVKETGAK